MTVEDERAELRELIRRAFAGVPYPGDARLVEEHCPECLTFSAALKGRRWTDYAEAPLELVGLDRQEIFAFMTPEAYHYYLPLALLACVDFYDDADLIPSTLVFQMAPRAEDGWRLERTGRLTEEQRRAVAAVLRHLRAAHPADFDDEPGNQLDAAVNALESPRR